MPVSNPFMKQLDRSSRSFCSHTYKKERANSGKERNAKSIQTVTFFLHHCNQTCFKSTLVKNKEKEPFLKGLGRTRTSGGFCNMPVDVIVKPT